MPSGELLEGEFDLAVNAWESIGTTAMGTEDAGEGTSFGYALLKTATGVTIEINFIFSGSEGGGSGTALTSDRKRYEVFFRF